jgi:hypothetical protein
VKLTPVERMMLMNQSRILAKLDPPNADDHEQDAEIFQSGYEGLYSRVFQHIYEPLSAEISEEVFEIFNMYRALDHAYKSGVEKPKTGRPEFAGFDGNNDQQIGIATFILHPLICAFNSDLFYEGRLKSRPGLERQEIRIKSGLNGSGLRYLPVQHDGNQSSSPEEADAIRDLIADILGSGTTWVDRKGSESPISLDDILIIAPYNAQVFELRSGFLALASAPWTNFRARRRQSSSIPWRPPVMRMRHAGWNSCTAPTD